MHKCIFIFTLIKVHPITCTWHPLVQAPVIMEKRCLDMNAKLLDGHFRQILGEHYKLDMEVIVQMDLGDKCLWDVLFKVETMELLIIKLQVTLVQDALARFIN